MSPTVSIEDYSLLALGSRTFIVVSYALVSPVLVIPQRERLLTHLAWSDGESSVYPPSKWVGQWSTVLSGVVNPVRSWES